MSRISVFDLDNQPVGAFEANCNRTWVLLGNTGVSDGAYTTVTVPDDVAAQPWLQFGRMVLVQHPTLPDWVGMIDTPWKATSPVEITLYNIEYLLSIRDAESSVVLQGSMPDVIRSAIGVASIPESMFMVSGNSYNTELQFSRVLEQGQIWDQVLKMLEETGYELIFRPGRNIDKQLILYSDIGQNLGMDTGYLLHDGEGANITVEEAHVDGEIYNRIKGVSGQASEEGQLQTDVFTDATSQSIYRARSKVERFRNVTDLALLTQYTQNELDIVANPNITLTINAREETFPYLRVGNRLPVHVGQLFLPGGVQAWEGDTRILAMTYDEENNVVIMTVQGIL